MQSNVSVCGGARPPARGRAFVPVAAQLRIFSARSRPSHTSGFRPPLAPVPRTLLDFLLDACARCKADVNRIPLAAVLTTGRAWRIQRNTRRKPPPELLANASCVWCLKGHPGRGESSRQETGAQAGGGIPGGGGADPGGPPRGIEPRLHRAGGGGGRDVGRRAGRAAAGPVGGAAGPGLVGPSLTLSPGLARADWLLAGPGRGPRGPARRMLLFPPPPPPPSLPPSPAAGRHSPQAGRLLPGLRGSSGSPRTSPRLRDPLARDRLGSFSVRGSPSVGPPGRLLGPSPVVFRLPKKGHHLGPTRSIFCLGGSCRASPSRPRHFPRLRSAAAMCAAAPLPGQRIRVHSQSARDGIQAGPRSRPEPRQRCVPAPGAGRYLGAGGPVQQPRCGAFLGPGPGPRTRGG